MDNQRAVAAQAARIRVHPEVMSQTQDHSHICQRHVQEMTGDDPSECSNAEIEKCKLFQAGKCSFGDQCKYAHSNNWRSAHPMLWIQEEADDFLSSTPIIWHAHEDIWHMPDSFPINEEDRAPCQAASGPIVIW